MIKQEYDCLECIHFITIISSIFFLFEWIKLVLKLDTYLDVVRPHIHVYFGVATDVLQLAKSCIVFCMETVTMSNTYSFGDAK